MRVVRYEQHGGPEVLQVLEADEPRPGPGQVSLDTEMIAGSWIDTLMRAGATAFGPTPLPGSPHGEVVGTVRAVGPGVDPALTGVRLAALVETDAYADVVLADVAASARVPDGVSSANGTVLAMAALVGGIALEFGSLAPGETVLVHASAGSIGHLTVQLARLAGARRVIGTVGSAAKEQFVRDLGADAVVSLADDDWAQQVRAAAPDGVDLVVDSVGGAVSTAGLGVLSAFGRLVVFGAASGSLPDVASPDLLGLRSVLGFGFREWRAARPDAARRLLAELTGHLATGLLRPAEAAVVPLDDPARAHRLLADRSRTGRVLIAP